jgi:hypothetical protein
MFLSKCCWLLLLLLLVGASHTLALELGLVSVQSDWIVLGYTTVNDFAPSLRPPVFFVQEDFSWSTPTVSFGDFLAGSTLDVGIPPQQGYAATGDLFCNSWFFFLSPFLFLFLSSNVLRFVSVLWIQLLSSFGISTARK